MKKRVLLLTLLIAILFVGCGGYTKVDKVFFVNNIDDEWKEFKGDEKRDLWLCYKIEKDKYMLSEDGDWAILLNNLIATQTKTANEEHIKFYGGDNYKKINLLFSVKNKNDKISKFHYNNIELEINGKKLKRDDRVNELLAHGESYFELAPENEEVIMISFYTFENIRTPKEIKITIPEAKLEITGYVNFE